MFKITTIIVYLSLIASCSTTTNTTPSWVFDVIAGNKLEISIGQDVYFRTSYKENNKSTETLCELATNQIKKNIEKAYPWVNVSDIPLKNPLKWYPLKDKNNICFVSYSVPKSYLETREFQRSYIGVMGKSQDTGILSLITKPVNDAVVYIDGTAVQTKNSNFDYGIQTGKHKLKIEHPYYETIEEDFDIKKGKTLEIERNLKLKKIDIKIDTSSVVAADVLINGKQVGKTPLTYKIALNSNYKIELKHNEMKDASTEIFAGEYGEKDNNHLIDITMEYKPSFYSFSSIPTGADVYLNNKFIGKTPIMKHSISPSTYNVNISKKGYKTHHGKIMVKGGSSEKYPDVNLIENAQFSVKTIPKNVPVYIDNEYSGVSPISTELDVGKHLISIRANGYEGIEEEIDVSAGKSSKEYTLNVVKQILLKKKEKRLRKSKNYSVRYNNSGTVNTLTGYITNLALTPIRVAQDVGQGIIGFEEFDGTSEIFKKRGDWLGYYLLNLVIMMPARVIYDGVGSVFGKANYDVLEGF